MNKNIFLILIFFFIIVACSKDEESCRYNLNFHPIDTSLYISYEIDGVKYKNYQYINTAQINFHHFDSIAIHNHVIYIKFQRLNQDNIHYHSDILYFYSYEVKMKNEISTFPLLSNIIKDSYSYYSPPQDPELSDTIFMNGIVFFGEVGHATSKAMYHFDFNIDSINNFYSNNSYFLISSVEETCNNLYLVKGIFSTKIFSRLDPFEVMDVENGQFCFIVN